MFRKPGGDTTGGNEEHLDSLLSQVNERIAFLEKGWVESQKEKEVEMKRPVERALIRALSQHRASVADLWKEPLEILLKLFLGFMRLAVFATFVLPIVAVIMLLSLAWISTRMVTVFIGVTIHATVRLGLKLYHIIPRPAWNGFVGFWNRLIDKIVTLTIPLPCGLVAIINAVQDAIEAIKVAIEDVKKFVEKAAETVAKPFKAVGGFFKKIFRRRMLSHGHGSGLLLPYESLNSTRGDSPLLYEKVVDTGYGEEQYHTAQFEMFGSHVHGVVLESEEGPPWTMGDVVREMESERAELHPHAHPHDVRHHRRKKSRKRKEDRIPNDMKTFIMHDDQRVKPFLDPGSPRLAALLTSMLLAGHQTPGEVHTPKPIIHDPYSKVVFHMVNAHQDRPFLTPSVFSESVEDMLHERGGPSVRRYLHRAHDYGREHMTPELTYEPHECTYMVTDMVWCIHEWKSFHEDLKMSYDGDRQTERDYCKHVASDPGRFGDKCEVACRTRPLECSPESRRRRADRDRGREYSPASSATRRTLLATQAGGDGQPATLDPPSPRKTCPNNKHNVPLSLNLGNIFKFMMALRINSHFDRVTTDDWEWLRRMRMCGCEYFTTGTNVLQFFAQKILGPPFCRFGKSLRRSNQYIRKGFEYSTSWALLRNRRHQVTKCENIITALKTVANGVFNSLTLGTGTISDWGDLDDPPTTFDNCVTESTGLENYCSVWGVGFMLIFFCAVMIVASVVLAFYDLYIAIIKFWFVAYRILVLNLILWIILSINTFLVQYRYSPELRLDVLRAGGLAVDTVGDAWSVVYSTDVQGPFKILAPVCRALFAPVQILFRIFSIVCGGLFYHMNCCNIKRRTQEREMQRMGIRASDSRI